MNGPHQLKRGISRFFGSGVVQWRSGSMRGQRLALACLLLLAAFMLAGSLVRYEWLPATSFLVPLLLGSFTLRFRPLLVLGFFIIAAAVFSAVVQTIRVGPSPARAATVSTLVLCALILMWIAKRSRSGLPGPLGDAMLVDLRDRLQAQGTVPTLPDPWRLDSAMFASEGLQFAGDFKVVSYDEKRSKLDVVLVDVAGKGVAAGVEALQLSGALGGLIGQVCGDGLLRAANAYLLRHISAEAFATAVYVSVDLGSGDYDIISAGHPPALKWHNSLASWELENARGLALGVDAEPMFGRISGTLLPGEALMVYTDGVVESRHQDISEGIAWLRGAAHDAIMLGFSGAPARILREVRSEHDDRAVMMLSRDG